MPSQHMGTFLTEKELEIVEETLKKVGISRYRLFKDAIREYCESRLKEEVKNDRGKDESKRGEDFGKDSESGEENRLSNDIFG